MDGRRLSFEEEGIFNGVFVMRDRETGTLWSHYTGEAFEGPLKGRSLDWVQTARAQFGDLKNSAPKTLMPNRDAMLFRPDVVPASGRADELGEMLPGAFKRTMPANRDRRLPRHEHGLGVYAAGAHRFFPLDQLGAAAVVNDELGEVPLVVLVLDGTEFATVYSRCLEGKTMTFSPVQRGGERAMKDAETGTVWSADGHAREGPLRGKRLRGVRSIVSDWYGWIAYFPKSTIHDPDR